MPSLLNSSGFAFLEALVDYARVGGAMFKAAATSSETLVLWNGNGAVFSGVISRTGVFGYERAFHESGKVGDRAKLQQEPMGYYK